MTAEMEGKRFVADKRADDLRTAESPRSAGGPSEKAVKLRSVKKSEAWIQKCLKRPGEENIPLI